MFCADQYPPERMYMHGKIKRVGERVGEMAAAVKTKKFSVFKIFYNKK